MSDTGGTAIIMTSTSTRPRRGSFSLQVYLSEIRDIPLLTADEEIHLAQAVARGDQSARTRMIEANLKLVAKIAGQFVGGPLGVEDLIAEGNVGLIHAVECFDPDKGNRFSTYAVYWIKQSIYQALMNTTATIRLPAHMVGLLRRWARTVRDLGRRLGREPYFDEVADTLQLTEAQREMVAQAMRARHMVREGSSDSDSTWSSEEASDSRLSPELECESNEEQAAVLRRLDRLDDRERMIISLRFGLEGQEPQTLIQIGRRLGITREWVRKIELRAVSKLGDSFEKPCRPHTERPRARALARTA